MKEQKVFCCGQECRLLELDTAVIGTGCAGYNAADWLYDLGRRDVAIFTEGVNCGTSRNTGSDKQTYYKLSLASDGADSVREMAQTLFEGEGVQGEIALSEAANSVKCFMKLANLGVPFPTNRYGEYVGYKTDHDPRQRATSAGPLTSKFMTEALERSVKSKGIPVLDQMQAVRLIVSQNRLRGLICLDTKTMELVLVSCNQMILATGGPAGIYAASVYPFSQTGGSGLAIDAGAVCSNLQEWQYGLASLKFRWNVSGTYQQVLPRYISVDSHGQEREFLTEYFDTPQQALDMVFLKGYQWPFDTAKVNGSSLIDLIVYHETVELGNRVYLDYRRNPKGLENGFEQLGEETYRYLQQSGALMGTPIERLEKMNPKAIELYQSHQIDLYQEPLEIGLCAQHHNGGIAVDSNWESSVKGLFVAGEAAGTFGVCRPGGSALNSTQVGSMRAAEHIADTELTDLLNQKEFLKIVTAQAGKFIEQMNCCLERMVPQGESNVRAFRRQLQQDMSRFAAQFRYPQEISRMRKQLEQHRNNFFQEANISTIRELGYLLRNYDILITQQAVLCAMEKSCEQAGSRGSALVMDPNGKNVSPHLPGFSYRARKTEVNGQVLLTKWDESGFHSFFQPVHPIPQSEEWFETVWSDYRHRTAARFPDKKRVDTK